ETGAPRLQAGLLRFGIRLLPLLAGEVRLSGAALSDAQISFADLPAAPENGFLASIGGEDGLVGADELVPKVFDWLRAGLTAMDGAGTGRFAIRDVVLDLGGGRRLAIVRAELAEAAGGAA